MIYLLVFIYLILTAVYFENGKTASIKNGRNYYIIECLVLVLLFGLRYRIGGDSIRYEEAFDTMPKLSNIEFDFFTLAKYQPLWLLLNSLIKSISDSFVVLQIVQSLFVNGVVFFYIQKKCKYKFSVVVFYYLLYYQFFTTEILRESISITIFMLAYDYLREKKFLKYYLAAIVAILFHASGVALLFIPLFGLFKRKKFDFASLSIFIFFSSFVLSSISMQFLDSFSNDSYLMDFADYYMSKSSNFNGSIYAMRYLIPYILCLCILRYIPELDTEENRLIFLSYLILRIIAISFPPLSRFSHYFSIITLVVIIQMIRTSHPYKYKILVYCSLFIILLNQFSAYNKDYSYYNYGHPAHYYNVFIPYSSIIIPQMDPVRENIVWGQKYANPNNN